MSCSTTLSWTIPERRKPRMDDKFLFVECSGLTGHPSRTFRPLLNRHVTGKPVSTVGYHAGEIILEDARPARRKSSTDGPSARKTRRASQPVRNKEKSSESPKARNIEDIPERSIDDRPCNPTETPAPCVQTLVNSSDRLQQDLAQWWFYCGDELLPPWKVAQYHWGSAAWDLARNSPLFLECLELYSWRKRAQLTGHTDRYLAQQLLLIRRVKDNLVKHGEHLESEPFALVAIGILAYVSLLDANIEASGTHLRALRAFDLAKHFEHSKQGWLYMVWVDLRYSLIQAIPPVLDYFVPLAFRNSLPSLPDEQEERIQYLASQESAMSPSSPVFSAMESHCVFLKLHRLYEAWPSIQESQFTAYGLLYDLEYRLRVTHANLRQSESKDDIYLDNESISLNNCVELILLAIQLHVWILSRHWAPISTYTRQTTLNRACDLLNQTSAPILVAKWTFIADVRSLIWCLSTITACSIETNVDRAVTPLRVLQYALADHGVFTNEELVALMREWFWLENWHPQKIGLVWQAVEERDFEAFGRELQRERRQKGRNCFFVGAVEFYNDR